jgi:hypothetical protein
MLTDISGVSVKVPENRGRLLHEFMTRFLEREQQYFPEIQPLTIEILLSDLAFAMRSEGLVSVTLIKARHLLQSRLSAIHAPIGVVEALDFLLQSKILREVGDQLAFFHELIQEYYAALELRSRYEYQPEIIKTYQQQRWWSEAMVLFFGLVDNKDGLLSKLTEENISLSAKCVMDAPIPNEHFKDQVVQKASAVLDRGEGGQSAAFEALGLIDNDGARKTLLRRLTSRQELEDFLVSFTADPVSSAVEMLWRQPSSAVTSATLRVLKRKGAAKVPIHFPLRVLTAHPHSIRHFSK